MQAPAITGLGIGIERIAGAGWQARDIRFRLDLSGAPRGSATVARLIIGDRALSDVSISCGALQLGPMLRCADAQVMLDAPHLGQRRANGEITWNRPRQSLELELTLPAIAGGTASLTGRWQPDGWRLHAELRALAGKPLAALVPGGLLEGWSVSGRLEGTLNAEGSASAIDTDGRLRISGLSFSDSTGLRAGEALGAELEWQLRQDAEGRRGTLSLNADAGQLYVDPVFLDLAAAPVGLRFAVQTPNAFTPIEMTDLRLAQEGVLSAAGDAIVSLTPPYLASGQLTSLEATLPAAFETWAQPFLLAAGFPEISTAGQLSMEGEIEDDLPRAVHVRWRDGKLARGGLSLSGIDAQAHWTAPGRHPPAGSRIAWEGGKLFDIGLGAAQISLDLNDRNIILNEPVSIPLLDGSLRLDVLALRGLGGDSPSADLDARLRSIGLGKLAEALGWPPLSGTLTGRLPSLTYRNGTATLGGELALSAFDGEIRAEDLRLSDPFGQVPVLQATGRLRGLDLQRLTQAFSFGRITGRLDGDVEDLRLVGWRPASFRAWFRTPADDRSRHRISQRAVENLTSLGGGGATGALSRGLLSLFEEFSYGRLGLGCALSGSTCVMRGLEDTDNGYVIVRGAGLPRVDVIGHTRKVSWPTLVQQLVSVTKERKAVIK